MKFHTLVEKMKLDEAKLKKGTRVSVNTHGDDFGPDYPFKDGSEVKIVKFIGYQGPFGEEYQIVDDKGTKALLTRNYMDIVECATLDESRVGEVILAADEVLEKYYRGTQDWEDVNTFTLDLVNKMIDGMTDPEVLKFLRSKKYKCDKVDEKKMLKELNRIVDLYVLS